MEHQLNLEGVLSVSDDMKAQGHEIFNLTAERTDEMLDRLEAVKTDTIAGDIVKATKIAKTPSELAYLWVFVGYVMARASAASKAKVLRDILSRAGEHEFTEDNES